MADELLNLCKESIDCSTSIAFSSKIYMQQCKLLALKLSDTRTPLQFVISTLGARCTKRPDCTLAAKELHRVVKRAQKMITDCCRTDRTWLETAIKQGSIKEACAELLFDLQWCISVLCSLFRPTLAIGEDGKYIDVPERMYDETVCERKLAGDNINCKLLVELAAKQDEESLKNLLKDLKKDHNCDGKCRKHKCMRNVCLAAQLVKMLDAAADLEQPAIDAGSIKNKTAPIFLMVNPHDLPGGAVIGYGGFAYVQETSYLREKYVKKVMPRDYNTFFMREATALATLTHPHVVRLVCCSEDTKNCELVMERMEMDLFDLLEKYPSTKPFSDFQVIDLMLQIAQGMEYIHSTGMAHRDLKSRNILIKVETFTPANRFPFLSALWSPWSASPPVAEGLNYIAKVADFGLTKLKNASTAYDNQTLKTGTSKWMAPEMWPLKEGEEPPSRFYPLKTDVYSFGIVFFEVMTGRDPFPDTGDLLSRVQAGERPPLPEHTPRWLAHLIQQCWHKDPIQRPDFPQICTRLRYIKGLLLRGDKPALQDIPEIHVAFQAEEAERRLPVKPPAQVEPSSASTWSADPLGGFEQRCPPGGEDRVVLYITSLNVFRKTRDDCKAARSVMRSLNVVIDERDVYIDAEFQKQLKTLIGKPVPQAFIKGRYIGGIAEIVKLHENDMLATLVDGLPPVPVAQIKCDGCGDSRFVACSNCNSRCPQCNENGLMLCPICKVV